MARETPIQVLRPGTKLRSKERIYDIVKVLGSGSFGITYLATAKVEVGNISIKMKFAIKEHFVSASCFRGDDGKTVLSVPQAKSDVSISRSDFITEANRLKKLCLRSRNIVSVNETFEANGTAYYVMEYLDGGTPSRCSAEKAISIAMQIADALDEIHKEHVLHLDLKPDNIVLKTNESGETYPVLIDFGISKHFDSKGRPTSSIDAKGASPGYAPQEQYAGVKEFSPKYDIYALGAVLFNLCTGKNPPDAFQVSPNQQELKKELTGKVTSNVEKAILNAMRPSAMERTPDIQMFRDDLMGIDFTPVLDPKESSVYFEKVKGQRIIHVDSNISWTVYAEEKWCKVTRKDNNIVLSVTENKEVGDRNCKVIITSSSYQVSRTITVKQKGRGTEVFPPKPSWWIRNRKSVYRVGGVALAGCVAVGSYFALKPDPQEEAYRLTAAIETMDGVVLKKFAERDSVRAYLPYAQFLFQNEDYVGATDYATKALTSVDSINAAGLLSQINTSMMALNQVHNETTEVQEAPAAEPETNETEQIQTVSSTEEVKQETNDEKFARASVSNDFNLMRSLAQDNYVKAYYPLALMYYNKGDKKNAKLWATKAISSNINRSQAQQLLDKLELKLPSNDELFAAASTIEDYKSLADNGYAKAYAPLAELYLDNLDYKNALKYAQKVNTKETKLICTIIKEIDTGNRLYVKWKNSNSAGDRIAAIEHYTAAVNLRPKLLKNDKSVANRIKELEDV